MKEQVIDLWESLYKQGLTNGTESFNDPQRILYNYIDLLTYLEMGGFSGFLYNNIDKEDRIQAFTHCLHYFGLAEQVKRLNYIYSKYNTQERINGESWNESLIRASLQNEVDELEDSLYNQVVNIPIEEWIERNYKELSIN